MDGRTDTPKPAAARISAEQGEGSDVAEQPIPEEHLWEEPKPSRQAGTLKTTLTEQMRPIDHSRSGFLTQAFFK